MNTANSNVVDTAQPNPIRAESVPPNVVCTNQAPFLPRAQSEQPNFPTFNQQATSSASPYRQYSNTCQTSPLYRGGAPASRILRHNSILNGRGVNPVYYETEHHQYPNNYLNTQNLSTSDSSSSLLNNEPPPIFMHHNNNTSASNNANINNLHQQNLPNNIAPPSSALSNISGSNSANNLRVYSPTVSHTPALNNQVAPGNRANNYWDNFRR